MAEQIPDLTRRHARRTNALTAQLTDIALFLGGRPATGLDGARTPQRAPGPRHDVWLADVRLDGQRELRTLAAGIRRDRTAALATLTATFTSGTVEGNVTRIKLLKRQMYGRASVALLRRRILLPP
ncbi:MAG: transposase [Streptomyces sp.]|nr:transposase [Streptomyces sp.]